ncbi:MAG: RDD family protein [Georgenia sp.]
MPDSSTTSVTRPVAGLGRRIAALLIDWALASAISAGFFAWDAMVTLGIFALMTFLLVGTLSATIGHVALGLGVRTLAGGPAGPGRAFVRTLALCLVIPAVVWGRDGRGLHDVWAGTVVTRVR